MLHDSQRFPADARAGEWHPACSESLRELALQCVAEKAHRPDSMADVVKRLWPLVSEHCPETALEISVQNELISLYRKQQNQIVADALKQREVTALAKQRAQRQRRSCIICGDDDKFVDSVIECSECHSHFCVEDFQRDIRVQCGYEDRSKFVKNQCSIVCCICRSNPFSDREVFAFVDDATFAIISQARADVVELQAYNKAKTEFQSKVEEMRNELMRLQGESERRIHRHRLHICENIFTLKCPRCERAFIDFEPDHCLALKCDCTSPPNQFCGWCLKDCGSDAHPHVRTCPKNLTPGNLFASSPEQFMTAHRARMCAAVSDYLNTLPKDDANQVFEHYVVLLL
jgi:hypothetical protein